MDVPKDGFDRLTHYVFRYPAKFHPPVARVLIERFTQKGDTVLDPFCGSGTLAVEARVLGRHAIATDIDPVAVFISKCKTLTPSAEPLQRAAKSLLDGLQDLQRSESEYERRMFMDLTTSGFQSAIRRYDLHIPAIPNIDHWFRRYVIVDLARILNSIREARLTSIHRSLFLMTFASIIRNASNADPVPVSGLEVTSHMKKRDDAGRIINPFALFHRALLRTVNDYALFSTRAALFSTNVRVLKADATNIDRHISDSVDAVITSPPYHNAVDYYRRHTLEMYWLGFVKTHLDRLALLPLYIGRARVTKSHPAVQADLNGYKVTRRWEHLLRSTNPIRADAFKHYIVSMRQCLLGLSQRVERGRPVVFIVGKSSWNGDQIPTVALFKELGAEHFSLRETHWYPLKNRYMSYTRQNGASIDREYVVVLERR